ncbi:hypothetical protein [Moraxella lacunata]
MLKMFCHNLPCSQPYKSYGRVRTTHLLSRKSYWCVIRTLLPMGVF